MTENIPREIPANELDLQMMTIEPDWGKNIPDDLKERLIKRIGEGQVIDKDGEIKYEVIYQYLWGQLSYFKRDMRLGNLSKEEVDYCCQHIELAADCLNEGYVQSFMLLLSRAINRIEISQSRRGFLRKRLGTVTSESYSGQVAPQKKGIFGQKQNQEAQPK